MNTNFDLYSQYYDLLYADKDYVSEVTYICNLITQFSAQPVRSLLELGCGTGIHACMLASQQDLNILGVDLSAEMLISARIRAAAQGLGTAHVAFDLGDARNFRSTRKFDVVASLFHVMSYQTTEADLQAVMQTAQCHLDKDGLFIFDFWYGPSVLSQQPSVRVKRLANPTLEVTRIAEPTVHDQVSVVDVNYTIFVKDLSSNQIEEIKETHSMRYLFLPEIDRLLTMHGFELILAEEWLTKKIPTTDTWGVCVVAKKK
jgi:SAM-dependent methyltransferase